MHPLSQNMLNKTLPPLLGYTNTSRLYSPITMSREWSTLGRLIFMVASACVGSTVNGFFVASFFIEHSLKRLGNVFHACVGMADMIITAGVMPISAVVLLSGQWDTVEVCQGLQFLAESATYCYSLFFTLVSAETYIRLFHPNKCYEVFISMRIGLVAMLLFLIAFTLAGVGTFLALDYDYCERLCKGSVVFRITTSLLFHILPSSLTLYFLFASFIRIRSRDRLQIAYKRSQQFNRDYSAIHLNIAAYLMYITSWAPYVVVVYDFPETTDTHFYHCAWIGVFRSLLTSIMYSSLNRSFRRAFAHLFYYCCCKSSISGPFHHRHRRALEYKPATGDVRVHIMHQAVTIHSRGQSATRETQEL